jgi:hypothetical protein
MKTLKITCAAFVAVAVAMLLVAPANAQWDLVDDWILGQPDAQFGPGDPNGTVWKINQDDTDNPAPPFIDTGDGYKPQPANLGVFISGYAHATRAVSKMYGTPGPVIIDPADQHANTGNWNNDPGAGPVDQGDIFAINGGCCGAGSAVNIWFLAPQDGEYTASLDLYSVGTNAGVDLPVDFGIRNGPGLPLLTGNYGSNISGEVPAYDSSVGREFVTYTLPPTQMLAGQHIMLRVLASSNFHAGNRNGFGMSSFEVNLVPEPTTAMLCSIASCALVLRRRRAS